MILVPDPSNVLTRIDPQSFKGLIQRRPRLSLLSRVVAELGSIGHHRVAIARAGILGRREFAFEGTAASICRKAGVRVTAEATGLGRISTRWKTTRSGADDVFLFSDIQLVVDITLVSSVHHDNGPQHKEQYTTTG